MWDNCAGQRWRQDTGSHGAAVIDIGNATRRILEGAKVLMDDTAGTVELMA